MSGGMNGSNGVPLLGQRKQQQQLAVQQMITSTYLSLIPVIAGPVIQNADLYADQEEIPDLIAERAWNVTRATLKKLGVTIPEDPEHPEGKAAE